MTDDIKSKCEDEGLSAKELEAVIARAKKRKDALSRRKPIAAVRKKLVAMAKADGYTIAELFGGASATAGDARATKAPRAPRKTTGIKVPPKYRNPANPEQTWTGRGKQPRWMAEEVSKGKKPEDFLIA